jgi:hypothetical protein
MLGMLLHQVFALDEKSHRAAPVLDELLLDELLLDELCEPLACCELSHDWNWAGGRATTWKNISEWYSPQNWLHCAR